MTRRPAIIVLMILVFATIASGVTALIFFNRLLDKIDRLNEDIASFRSARSVLVMTLDDASTVIRQSYSGRLAACNMLKGDIAKNHGSNPVEITVYWNWCPNLIAGFEDSSSIFISLYFKAMSARLNGDFAIAVDLYSQSLAAMTKIKAPDWQARAYEGRAYSQLNLGRIEAAKADIDLALKAGTKIDGGYVYAYTTAAKIMCKSRVSSSEVNATINEAKARLTEIRDRPQISVIAKKYVISDIRAIDADAELYRICSYANIEHANR